MLCPKRWLLIPNSFAAVLSEKPARKRTTYFSWVMLPANNPINLLVAPDITATLSVELKNTAAIPPLGRSDKRP
jgi:hypothetical protein